MARIRSNGWIGAFHKSFSWLCVWKSFSENLFSILDRALVGCFVCVSVGVDLFTGHVHSFSSSSSSSSVCWKTIVSIVTFCRQRIFELVTLAKFSLSLSPSLYLFWVWKRSVSGDKEWKSCVCFLKIWNHSNKTFLCIFQSSPLFIIFYCLGLLVFPCSVYTKPFTAINLTHTRKPFVVEQSSSLVDSMWSAHWFFSFFFESGVHHAWSRKTRVKDFQNPCLVRFDFE